MTRCGARICFNLSPFCTDNVRAVRACMFLIPPLKVVLTPRVNYDAGEVTPTQQVLVLEIPSRNILISLQKYPDFPPR